MTGVGAPAAGEALLHTQMDNLDQGQRASAFDGATQAATLVTDPPKDVVLVMDSAHGYAGWSGKGTNPLYDAKHFIHTQGNVPEHGATLYDLDDADPALLHSFAETDNEYLYIENRVYDHLIAKGSIEDLIISGHGLGVSSYYGDSLVPIKTLQAIERAMERARAEGHDVEIENSIQFPGCGSFRRLDENEIAYMRDFSLRTGIDLTGQLDSVIVGQGGSLDSKVITKDSYRVTFKDGIPYIDLSLHQPEHNSHYNGQIRSSLYDGAVELRYYIPEYALDIVNRPGFDPDDFASYQEQALDNIRDLHKEYNEVYFGNGWLETHIGVTAEQAAMNKMVRFRYYETGGVEQPQNAWAQK